MIPDGPAAELEELREQPAMLTDGNVVPEPTEDDAKVAKTEQPKLQKMACCYTCKDRFTELHHFYGSLCPKCASLNWTKRFQSADLAGRRALVTGGRVKIGFQIALKLLRAGADVVLTTRFPRDCAARYAAQPDFEKWGKKLAILSVDLRFTPQVEQFADFLAEKYESLNIVVHNACQTIRRPASYYQHLVGKETLAIGDIPEKEASLLVEHEKQSKSHSSQLVVHREDREFLPGMMPEGLTDVNGQQVDLRKTNSWLLKLDEVETPELAEVFLVNAMAPFVLNGRLKKMLLKSPHADRYIINVSAMEGKFYRHKLPMHPHTNMAKAALNMMTRTCAADYAKEGIYMNSADTGWINDEKPLEKAHAHAEKYNWQTPIDEIDAAARVLDCMFTGIKGFPEKKPSHGMFFKDYAETEW